MEAPLDGLNIRYEYTMAARSERLSHELKDKRYRVRQCYANRRYWTRLFALMQNI
jgi:hypothetical protein